MADRGIPSNGLRHMALLTRCLVLVVLAHFAVVVVHSASHFALGIVPGPLDSAYIVAVIVVGPLAALLLLRTNPTWSAAILAGLMIASFAYGIEHHFLAGGPDHVVIAPAQPWSAVFVGSAAVLGILEIAGFVLAIAVLWRVLRTPSAPSVRRA